MFLFSFFKVEVSLHSFLALVLNISALCAVHRVPEYIHACNRTVNYSDRKDHWRCIQKALTLSPFFCSFPETQGKSREFYPPININAAENTSKSAARNLSQPLTNRICSSVHFRLCRSTAESHVCDTEAFKERIVPGHVD